MTVNWSEAELKERLEKNPALKVNDRYSQAVKTRNHRKRIPKLRPAPLKFYDKELPVKLFLPFVYPSLNKLLRMNHWDRAREEEEFRTEVWLEIYKQGILGFKSRVSIEVTVYHPEKRNRDKDNFCYKWIKDALKGSVIIDDDPRYVEDLPVKFEKGKKRMEVWIRPIETEEKQ